MFIKDAAVNGQEVGRFKVGRSVGGKVGRWESGKVKVGRWESGEVNLYTFTLSYLLPVN